MDRPGPVAGRWLEAACERRPRRMTAARSFGDANIIRLTEGVPLHTNSEKHPTSEDVGCFFFSIVASEFFEWCSGFVRFALFSKEPGNIPRNASRKRPIFGLRQKCVRILSRAH